MAGVDRHCPSVAQLRRPLQRTIVVSPICATRKQSPLTGSSRALATSRNRSRRSVECPHSRPMNQIRVLLLSTMSRMTKCSTLRQLRAKKRKRKNQSQIWSRWLHKKGLSTHSSSWRCAGVRIASRLSSTNHHGRNVLTWRGCQIILVEFKWMNKRPKNLWWSR